MRTRLPIMTVVVVLALSALSTGCGGAPKPEAGEEPAVLESGSTEPNPDYFVTDTGEIIYNDSRTRVQGETDPSRHNPALAPVFPGSQRIHPANEDPSQRESYLVRAPLDAVEQFYTDYLAAPPPSDEDSAEPVAQEETNVNSISSHDESGRKQTALFVNQGDGATAGLKVMLKEFPAQHAVQIVLTTLDATPPGLDPYGIYVTPDEVAKWAEEAEAEREELERRRAEAESRVVNPDGDDDSESSDDENPDEEDG